MKPAFIPRPSSLILYPLYFNTMPIIINELHIKARVSDQGTGQQQLNNGGTSNTGSANGQNADNEQIKKSVEAIMDILKRKNER
jgi:hypothetical protein